MRNFTNMFDARFTGPAQKPVLYVSNDDSDEYPDEIELPVKWEVCSVCNGKGTHVNPAIDCDGISAQEFADDPDFRDEYMSGTYDIQCNSCQGRTTVEVVDLDQLTPEQKKAYQQQLDDEYNAEQEHRAELAAGA